MNKRSVSEKEERIIRPWVILGGLAIGIVMLVFTCLLVTIFRANPSQNTSPTAVVRLIPAPTATQTISPLSIGVQTTGTPVLPGQNLGIGSQIRVQGTGGDGLRLRSAAGLSGEIKHLVYDGEELVIDDGPEDIDGYTWWHVTSSTNPVVSGWGVSDYMVHVQSP